VWGHPGSDAGGFTQPTAIAVAADGSVYVSDTGNHRIQKFTSDGRFVTAWGERGRGTAQLWSPVGIAVNRDAVFVADQANHRIVAFSLDGAVKAAWGSFGTGDGQFRFPSGVAVDADDRVYVADTGNNRVQVFTGAGVFLDAWGRFGRAPAQFDRPAALAASSDGRVAVVEAGGAIIQVFSKTGRLLQTISTPDASPDRDRPRSGVAIDAAFVYATDLRLNHVDRVRLPPAAAPPRRGPDADAPTTAAPAGVPISLQSQFPAAVGQWLGAFSAGASGAAAVDTLPTHGEAAVSESIYPHLWWPDGNHSAPGGTGFLGLVAVHYLRERVDLTGASWTVQLRLEDPSGNPGLAYAGPRSSSLTRLVPWFQTFDRATGRWVNFAAVGAPLDIDEARGGWATVRVTPSPQDWMCLGSSLTKISFYGCGDIQAALRSVEEDLGFILFPLDRRQIPAGRVLVRSIAIDHPASGSAGR
jgi:sugar lactone lactonase YvrE